MRVVGEDAHLPTGVASRRDAALAQGDRKQSDRHLLARRRDDVDLARIGIRGQLLRQSEEAIRFARHRRHDDDELVAVAMEARHALCDAADAIGGTDRRAAVFLDDQRHCITRR